jgi:hypothetical protein
MNSLLSFILLPVLAFVFMIVVWFIAKTNKLLNNKKFIFYVLITTLILSLPSLLGFFDYWFMPYIYIALQVLYLFLGWLNVRFINKRMIEISDRAYIFEILLIGVVLLLGMAVFSVVFNLLNELKYGIFASTCLLPFLFASLYRKTYQSYINIPLEIYNMWSYNPYKQADKDNLDINNLMVVDIELFKDSEDTDLLHITAKTSENIAFGEWFEIFLTDYNKKAPLNPIHFFDEGQPYNWMFYVQSSFLKMHQFIDPDLSFKENKIKPHSVIIARRIKDIPQYTTDIPR